MMQTIPLRRDTLDQIERLNLATIPHYDPANVTPRVFHIGPSGFSRAHLAKFLHDQLNDAALNGQPLDWGMVAVGLRRADVRNALQPQNYLYTLTTKGGSEPKIEVIGSLVDILPSRDNSEAVILAAAQENIRIISLTVTQKGYYDSNLEHPDIKACLDQNSPELSSIGLIVHSLKYRKDNGIAAPVILSCDNLTGNGNILKNAVLAYAQRIDPSLTQWIDTHVPFLNTMVDRITPSRDNSHVDFVRNKGIEDHWPIETEPMPKPAFVIEEIVNGAKSEAIARAGIRGLESQGVIFTQDVSAFENLKVRTLNGAHMALGCIGYLMGLKYSNEAMNHPLLQVYARGFMDEVGKILTPVKNVKHSDFAKNVEERLLNSEISDPLTRLARKGIDKINTRFLDSMRDCISRNENFSHLAFATAAWLHYVAKLDDKGYLPEQTKSAQTLGGAFESVAQSEEPNDEKVAKKGFPQMVRDNMTHIQAVFSRSDIFPDDIRGNGQVLAAIIKHFNNIHRLGMTQALNQFLTEGQLTPRVEGNPPSLVI